MAVEQPIDAEEPSPFIYGLTVDILKVAVEQGEFARASCTANDPAIIPGVMAWGRTMRVLRDQLLPQNWTRSCVGNFDTVVSPDRKVAISVSTGDENTGRPNAIARTKYPKGPATAAVINRNQVFLFEEDRKKFDAGEQQFTWILLIHSRDGVVVSELSLPASVDENGIVSAWTKRIFLPVFNRGSAPTGPVADDEPDIEIEVTRKSK